MNVKELLEQEKEQVRQLDISDELKGKTLSLLSYIGKKRKFGNITKKRNAIKTVTSVVEKIGTLEALDAAKVIINGYYQFASFHNYNKILYFSLDYESSELVSSIAEVLVLSHKFDLTTNTRSMFNELICRENIFSLETLVNVNDVFKSCTKRRLQPAQVTSNLSNYTSVIKNVADSCNTENNSGNLETLIGFYKEACKWKDYSKLFYEIGQTFEIFHKGFYPKARRNFVKLLDLYKDNQDLIKELCINNSDSVMAEPDFRKSQRLDQFFKSVISPKVSSILKSTEMRDYISDVTKIIRKINHATTDTLVVESLVEKAHDYVLNDKDVNQLVGLVDVVVKYTNKVPLNEEQFKHLISMTDQLFELYDDDNDNDFIDFSIYHGEIYLNIKDQELRESLNNTSINSLVNAYQSVVTISSKWSEPYSQTAKDSFFDILNNKLFTGESLKEKERILKEFSSNVVYLVKDNLTDLVFTQPSQSSQPKQYFNEVNVV
jgi:hypothetical protein